MRFSTWIFISNLYCNWWFHDFLSFVKTRVCRIYFTTYLSQDRMFSFLFLQNFLKILRPLFWVCSAVSLPWLCSLLCARNLNFDEICLDLSGTMCIKKLRSKFMSKTLSLMCYCIYFITLYQYIRNKSLKKSQKDENWDIPLNNFYY